MASIPLLRPFSAVTTTVHHHRKIPPPLTSFSLHHPLRSLTTTIPSLHKTPINPSSKTLKTKNPKKPISPISCSLTTPATDRLISSLGYFLPFLNGLQYGRFLFAQYPSLTVFFQPFLPIFSLYKTLPYGSFIAFFALYLGVVRNPSFSHYVRFNAMQALVLDVLLVLPLLIMRIFTPGRSGLGFKLMVMGHNGLFVFLVFCFGYSLVCSLLGKTPYLPFVADAAGRQL